MNDRRAMVGLLGLVVGFLLGYFSAPPVIPPPEHWVRRAQQAAGERDLLRRKVELLEAQLAEINAVLEAD